MPPLQDGRRGLATAKSACDLRSCHSARSQGKGARHGAITCTNTQKAKYRRRKRTVAAMTSSLSLAVAPMAGSARNLPGKEANSACAQAQACWEREAASGRKQVGRARAAVQGACGRRRSEVQGERTYASDGAEQDGEPPEGAVVGGVSPAATPPPTTARPAQAWLQHHSPTALEGLDGHHLTALGHGRLLPLRRTHLSNKEGLRPP